MFKDSSTTKRTTRSAKNRQRRQVASPFEALGLQIREKFAAGNKRCIGDFLWGNSLLGAANPHAEDPVVASESVTQRYAKENIVGSAQNSDLMDDSSAVGSSKSETVLSKPIIVVQPDSADFLHPTFETPVIQPNDHDFREVLPLHDGVTESPIVVDYSSNNRKINYGPSALKTDPIYQFMAQKPKELDVGITKSTPPQINTPCQCDSAQFQNLLRQLDIGFQQYHQNVVQILNEYSANSNCGVNGRATTISNVEYDTAICADTVRVSSDPQLAAFCQNVNGVINVEPSSGVIEIPGQKPQPARGYAGQFISFADYAKMIQNPNFNPNSLNIVGAEKPAESNEDVVGLSIDNDANHAILKELKNLAVDQKVGNVHDSSVEKPETFKVSANFKEFLAKLRASGLIKRT